MATGTRGAREARGRAPMSDAHKAALAEGREQGRVVRRYLEAVEARQAKRVRRRSREETRRRLEAVESEMSTANPVIRLQRVQEILDLREELGASDNSQDRWEELEEDFVRCAGAYGKRKGISYAAWREIGVSAAVLRKAGITA